MSLYSAVEYLGLSLAHRKADVVECLFYRLAGYYYCCYVLELFVWQLCEID